MKVFELMNELSKVPAGANIICKKFIKSDEFLKCSVVDCDDGSDLRELEFYIKDVVSDDDTEVYFYD